MHIIPSSIRNQSDMRLCIKQDPSQKIRRIRPSTNLWVRHGEGAHSLSIFNRFWRHVRQNRAFSQSVATENASPFRSPPGNPEGFQEIGPSHQKRHFFDDLDLVLCRNFICFKVHREKRKKSPSAPAAIRSDYPQSHLRALRAETLKAPFSSTRFSCPKPLPEACRYPAGRRP